MASHSRPAITGLILAGGQGRRMSTDGRGVNKALQCFRGRRLIDQVIERLAGQVSEIIVNANDQIDQFERLGYRVVVDEHPGFQGPLAGVCAGLKASRTEWLLTVPCDSPFLPIDLGARLAAAAAGANAAVASNAGRLQPVFALLRATLHADLKQFLQAGDRKIDLWLRRVSPVVVEFNSPGDDQAFLNFNTLEELRAHER